MLRSRSQPRNGHRAIAAHQPDTAPPPPTPAPGHASNLVAPQPPSRRTGEQENPPQRNRPSSLDQTHPHTRRRNEAKPLETPQIVAGIENHRKAQSPRPNSACPKKLGQPHPAPPNASYSCGTKFPDRVVWVWKRQADGWPRIVRSAWFGLRCLWRWLVFLGKGEGERGSVGCGHYIHYTVRRLMWWWVVGRLDRDRGKYVYHG